MAVFRPFRAFRPLPDYQALIPAPPYDVLTAAGARERAAGNSLSFLHVDKAEIDLPPETDPYSPAVYEKARENLLALEHTGALVQDPAPCFYIYKQVMNGRAQVGLAGCAGVDDYLNGVIKQHEHTLAAKEADRIRHVDTCDANTGPIFLTYRRSPAVELALSTWMSEHTPVYDFVQDDVQQTVWVVDSAPLCEKLQGLFAAIPALYIADGHHRCASAVKVGLKRREEKSDYTGQEEFNFFLAVAFPDSELEILPYNRVVRDLNGLSPDALISQIEQRFIVKHRDEPVEPEQKGTFGMVVDREWYTLQIKPALVPDDPVGALDVSLLQDNLLSPILGIKDLKTDPRIDFVGGIYGVRALEKRAKTDMKLALSLYPTTIAELMAVADAGRMMPPKSTWFEPKLLSGLFVHSLSTDGKKA